MSKKILLAALLLTGYGLYNAQTGRVGINTNSPSSTLDINSVSSDANKGIMVPRVTAAEMVTMSSTLTDKQNSLLTYLNETMPAANRSGKLEFVYEKVITITHTQKANGEDSTLLVLRKLQKTTKLDIESLVITQQTTEI